jgi:hypothetical protein
VGTPTGRLEELPTIFPRSHSKIRDLDIFVARQHDILRFQVSMTDTEPMAVIQSSDYLLEIFGRLVWWETLRCDEKLE